MKTFISDEQMINDLAGWCAMWIALAVLALSFSGCSLMPESRSSLYLPELSAGHQLVIRHERAQARFGSGSETHQRNDEDPAQQGS
jgi:hypothetical protein